MDDGIRRCPEIFRTYPPGLRKLGERRLPDALIVRAARHEFCLLAAPSPFIPEPGMRLLEGRRLQLRVLPGGAAVYGDLHPPDRPQPGPGQSGYFIEALPGKLLPTGGKSNHGFRAHLEIEPARLAIRPQAGIIAALRMRHKRLVGYLDSPQPFDVANSLPSGNQQSQRISLVGPDRLAILAIGQHYIIHRLFQRDAHGVLHPVRGFGHEPAGILLHSGLAKDQ